MKKSIKKFITLQRTIAGDTTQSSLAIEKDGLVILGNLPHGSKISLDKKNALILLNWIDDYLSILNYNGEDPGSTD